MNQKRTLYLTLSKKAFDVMVTGEKSIEYRKFSNWIISRLLKKKYDFVKFTNGYGADRPYFIARYSGWEVEHCQNWKKYSNGLEVDCPPGTVKIYIGNIVEKGNLIEDK